MMYFKHLSQCQKLLYNLECTSTWIASSKYMDAILINPEITISVLQADMRIKYGVHVSKQKVYRTKKKAPAAAKVDHEESYKKLRDYAQIIFDKMPQAIAQQK